MQRRYGNLRCRRSYRPDEKAYRAQQTSVSSVNTSGLFFAIDISNENSIIRCLLDEGRKMIERILVPLDGSQVGESALRHVEDFISKLSPKIKVEVTLLHVLRPISPPFVDGDFEGAPIVHSEEDIAAAEESAMEYLNSAGGGLRNTWVTVFTKVTIGNAADEIARIANEINADIIAMSTHGRSGLSRWAFGSVTDRVLRSKNTKPVLLIRAPK